MEDKEMIEILVSQGVMPYIKIKIEQYDEGFANRDTTIAEIGRAVKAYDSFCHTGR